MHRRIKLPPRGRPTSEPYAAGNRSGQTFCRLKMPPPNREPFPSAPQAALLLLAGFMLQYGIGAVLYDFRQLLGLTQEQLAAIAMLLANGVVIAVVMHMLGIGYRGLLHPSKASPITTTLLLTPPVLLLIPLVVLLDMALIWTLEAIFPLSSWEQAAFASMVAPTLPAVIATCLIAPMVEEMLFRGILLRGFLERYPRAAAISYSALYFGGAHLNVYQFFLAFLLGLLLGWLYERSRSLIPCMVLHAAVNTSIFFWSTTEESATSQDPLAVSALAWLLAIGAGAIGALGLHRMLCRRERGAADVA